MAGVTASFSQRVCLIAYWQPQPPELAWLQHDGFSDGSQQLACLTAEQQLAGSAAGRGSLLLVGDDAAIA